MPALIAIVGRSDSGKTTLIERLIPELNRRGYRVGTIKHALHGFDLDREGKDSWRHRTAGAEAVMIASPERLAIVRSANGDHLQDLGRYFPDVDLILAEGYKRSNQPKIEVLRKDVSHLPVCLDDEYLIALVTDAEIDSRVPRFDLDSVIELADLIEKRYLASDLK